MADWPSTRGPAVHVYHNAAQSIVTGTNTPLAFNSELFDPIGMHDGGANTKITIKIPGIYEIGATLEWASNATGFRQAQLLLNNTTGIDLERITPVADIRHNHLVVIRDLLLNDFIEVVVHQTSGGGLNVNSSAEWSPRFWAHRVA